MNHLTRFRIMDELETKYCEWVEDLGLTREQILMTLLEKDRQTIEDLKRRLTKYEHR